MFRHEVPRPLFTTNEIGAAGFEPATSCSQSRRDTGLRYAPQISGRIRYPVDVSRSTGQREIFPPRQFMQQLPKRPPPMTHFRLLGQ